MSNYDRRNSGKNKQPHIFDNAGIFPWQLVGVDPSCLPDNMPEIDSKKLPDEKHHMFIGLVRLHDGTWAGKDGIDWYGNALGARNWLARLFNREAPHISEIICRKIYLNSKGGIEAGTAPTLGLNQEVYFHIALARTDRKKLTPDTPKVFCQGNWYGIMELRGQRVEEGLPVATVSEKLGDQKAWLEKRYAKNAPKPKVQHVPEGEDNPLEE